MRQLVAALCCATAMGLSACGGGGGGEGGGGTAATVPELRISAATGDSGRTPSGVVHMRRIEVRNVGGSSALAVVVSVSADAQALQLPLSCESAGCTQRSDGGVDIAEIAAGSMVVLRQPLRIKPGYRGAVRNDWQASATGSTASWRQELSAYVADVAVTVGDAATSATAPSKTTHEVTLTNHGPDEATDVSWELLMSLDQVWRIAGCTASAGANCPATLGEHMQLARLPVGATVRLQVQLDAPTEPYSRVTGVSSRADAAGDADPRDNESSNGPSSVEHLFMTDLEGRHYRLTWGVVKTLRAVGTGVDYRIPLSYDVTGQPLLGEIGGNSPLWQRGTFNAGGPISVLGLEIGGVRRPHLAPRRLVDQLSELEGFSFNVLGSRADANGKPLDAYVGSARFKDSSLQLCLPDTPVPIEQCPASRLTRYDAAWVGSEIELVSRDRAMRIRAARSNDGPVLISSSRDATTGASEFWIALPSATYRPFTSDATSLYETTFESASGQSAVMLASIDNSSTNGDLSPRVYPSFRNIPNSYLLFLFSGRTLSLCGLSAQLSASTQAGLFQGTLRGDWLPGTFENGEFVKERLCFAGAVHHAQTPSLAVFLGARGGDVMGRWMFVSE